MDRIKELERFILEFIPQGERFRKVTQNHINYITHTINGVFKKKSGTLWKYTDAEIVSSFKRLHYRSQGEVIFEHKHISNTVHINIKTTDMRSLYNVVHGLSENTNTLKQDEVNRFNDKLGSFFQRDKAIK